MTFAVMTDERPRDTTRFREVLGRFPTGVAVVAAVSGDRPFGLAVASFTSLSLDPPLVLFCAGKSSTSWPHIRGAGRFCVNVLAHDQQHVCKAFAAQSDDKFSEIRWRRSRNGSPAIEDCLAWIECDIADVHPGGDHDVVFGRVTELNARPGGKPLVFYRSAYGSFSESAEERS